MNDISPINGDNIDDLPETTITPQRQYPLSNSNRQPMQAKKTPPARIVVVENVYYQKTGEPNATATESRFSHWLVTDEQPYIRKIKVGEEWMPIDRGWIEGESVLMVIANNEGKFTQVQPTPKEREIAASKVVEVAIMSERSNKILTVYQFALILPGQSIRFTPFSIDGLRVRCRNGIAQCTLSIYSD